MTWQRWRRRYHGPGGAAELLALSVPLILSNSFWTLQIALDRIFLSRFSADALAAAMPGALLFWTPLILLQYTTNYATTFVAQYVGAGRPNRVGPAVWQALYFSVLAGLGFLVLVPAAPLLVALVGHAEKVRELEEVYFRVLCFSALPILITAAASSFFAGRGDSWTVLFINAFGLGVNALAAYPCIFGAWGVPQMGIAGAGWATVVGTCASALAAVALMFRSRYVGRFATRSGWRLDPALFGRLLYYGVPNGLQWAIDALGFTAFFLFVGRLGEAELAASNVAFTVNAVAFFPALGLGQGVGVLVGQRLGHNRPDLAERTTWTGFGLAWLYMTGVAAMYALAPGVFVYLFQGPADAGLELGRLVPVLLRFVALYSLFDSMNAVFACALRGAGDTHFVSAVSLGLSWPIMVLPTWAAWYYGWGLYWAWLFLTAYVVVVGLTLLVRFRQGRWKSMRVIESGSDPDGELPRGAGLAAVGMEMELAGEATPRLPG
jgi:MATE family multidrug resistance protein